MTLTALLIIEQALLLFGSSDFETEVTRQYIRPRRCRLEQEQPALRPLPPYRFADYDIEQRTVWRTSTIKVRKVVYSVPPRLIGRKVTVRILEDQSCREDLIFSQKCMAEGHLLGCGVLNNTAQSQ